MQNVYNSEAFEVVLWEISA